MRWILFACFLGIFLRAAESFSCLGSASYPHEYNLDDAGDVMVGWRLEEDSMDLHFGVTFRNLANVNVWAAIGFSRSGGMSEMDIAMLTASGELKDMFSKSQSITPKEDTSNDLELLCAARADGQIRFEFKRRLTTCDYDEDVDLSITYVALTYAIGTSSTFGYHGASQRGAKFMSIISPLAIREPDREPKAPIRFTNNTFRYFSDAQQSNAYRCGYRTFDISNQLRASGFDPSNPQQLYMTSFHIPQGESLRKAEPRLHHLHLYQCEPTAQQAASNLVFKQGDTTDDYNCHSIAVPPGCTFMLGMLPATDKFSFPFNSGHPIFHVNGTMYFFYNYHIEGLYTGKWEKVAENLQFELQISTDVSKVVVLSFINLHYGSVPMTADEKGEATSILPIPSECFRAPRWKYLSMILHSHLHGSWAVLRTFDRITHKEEAAISYVMHHDGVHEGIDFKNPSNFGEKDVFLETHYQINSQPIQWVDSLAGEMNTLIAMVMVEKPEHIPLIAGTHNVLKNASGTYAFCDWLSNRGAPVATAVYQSMHDYTNRWVPQKLKDRSEIIRNSHLVCDARKVMSFARAYFWSPVFFNGLQIAILISIHFLMRYLIPFVFRKVGSTWGFDYSKASKVDRRKMDYYAMNFLFSMFGFISCLLFTQYLFNPWNPDSLKGNSDDKIDVDILNLNGFRLLFASANVMLMGMVYELALRRDLHWYLVLHHVITIAIFCVELTAYSTYFDISNVTVLISLALMQFSEWLLFLALIMRRYGYSGAAKIAFAFGIASTTFCRIYASACTITLAIYTRRVGDIVICVVVGVLLIPQLYSTWIVLQLIKKKAPQKRLSQDSQSLEAIETAPLSFELASPSRLSQAEV